MTDSPRPDDVRMRGFMRRTPVERARQWVDAQPAPGGSEPVRLEEACGRVLATDIVAGCDVPAFDRSAMDGYALRGEATVGAGEYNPLEFQVVGESLPGRPFAGMVAAGQAVRIMTGAPLPAGADAVVPAEFARQAGNIVQIMAAAAPLKHVSRAGEDVQAGSLVLPASRCLRPQDVGVIASLGLPKVEVIRRPNVRIIVTGSEIVPPGAPRGPCQIYDANSAMLRGLVLRDGGRIESVVRAADAADELRSALANDGADVVLISGGSSVGAEDHAPRLLAELGELAIHGIAMRPSSPAGMGRLPPACVFLLPGNPVSCLCAYDFFAGRLIRRWGGRDPDWPYRRITVRLTHKIASEVGRVDYCRVRLCDEGAQPLALSGASILSSTTRADGFVVIPADMEGYPAGAEVEVMLYDLCG